jgi:RNA polymerase sigma-70 factor (family 1)
MTNFTKFDEEELINLMQQDSLGAFKEIYVRYWKKLYSEAYKRLNNKDTAEEVVQELFTTLWHKRHKLNISQSLGGYLYASVGYRVIDHYRKELIKLKHRQALRVVYSEADNSTEQAIMLKDLEINLNMFVKQLPDKCRSVYELSRIDHKTNKEIAQYLGISEKTVENHLTKALKRLRLSLNNYLMLLIIILLNK